MVMMAAAYVAAGDERTMRIAAAFDWNGVLAPANVRVDAWVTPPVYTGKPPVILSAANRDAAAPDSGPLPVPAGSTLLVRSSGGTIDVVVGGGLTEIAPSEQAPKGTNERQFKIAADGTAHVRAPAGQPQWRFAATPDRAPNIALAKDPERQARGSLQMSYKLEDDYGVTEARARFAVRSGDTASEANKEAGKRRQGRRQGGGAAAAVRAAAVRAGAAECADPQRRRPDVEGSHRGPLCRRRRDADPRRPRTRPATKAAASRSTCGCRSGCSPSRWRAP